jgi:hypothetical protein
MQSYAIEGAEHLALHQFYRAMAWLGKEFEEKAEGALAPRCVKDVIEDKLFDRRRDPIGFRCRINSLAILVKQSMEINRKARPIYAVCNRGRNRMKILLYDRSGFLLVLKRLEEDRFFWPREQGAPMSPLAATSTAHRQAFRPVQLSELLVMHDHPLAFQHHADPAVTKAAAPARDVLPGIADGALVRRAFAPDRLAIDTNQHAGSALRDWISSQRLEHRVASLDWRRQTLPSRSLRMTLSSMLPASRRLSLPFSSSS